MDGNNRYSKKKNISKFNSYKLGAKKLIKISEYIFKKYKVNFISAFALSKNNLGRSSKTILSIISILDEYIDEALSNNYNFKITFIGDLSFLDKNIKNKINKLEQINKYKKFNLIIFLNYSGQDDILNSIKKLKKNSSHSYNLKNYLATKNIPNPDLIIRSGGFKRISNFMLFEIAFTEFSFTKKLWSDLYNSDIDKFIKSYFITERKFGL